MPRRGSSADSRAVGSGPSGGAGTTPDRLNVDARWPTRRRCGPLAWRSSHPHRATPREVQR